MTTYLLICILNSSGYIQTLIFRQSWLVGWFLPRLSNDKAIIPFPKDISLKVNIRVQTLVVLLFWAYSPTL